MTHLYDILIYCKKIKKVRMIGKFELHFVNFINSEEPN